MKPRMPLALIGALLAAVTLNADEYNELQPPGFTSDTVFLRMEADTLTITQGTFSPQTSFDGIETNNTHFMWGEPASPVAGTIGSITNFNQTTVSENSSLVVKSRLDSLTAQIDGILTIDGGRLIVNEVFSRENSIFRFINGASGDIPDYLELEGKLTVASSTLNLGTNPSGTIDSTVGGNPSAEAALTIGNGGLVNAMKGLAIGPSSTPDMSKAGTVNVITGGRLVVTDMALRIGAGRTDNVDTTSGNGVLNIDGGRVTTDQLYVGDVRTQTGSAGPIKTYYQSKETKGAVIITNEGQLNVTTGEAGYHTVLGNDSLLSINGSGTLTTSSNSRNNAKWFVAEAGATLSLEGSRAVWNHAYQAAVREGSTFQMKNGAQANVYYLAYGSYDGTMEGTSTNPTTMTLGNNVIGWDLLDSSIGGETINGQVTTLTINPYAKLNALNGLAVGHRSTRDGIININADGALIVSGAALRVGAGRTYSGDGTAGDGTLNISAGRVQASALVLGDTDGRQDNNGQAGNGIIRLFNMAHLDVSGASSFGSGSSFSMDSSSMYNTSSLDIKGGNSVFGGWNNLGNLNIDPSSAITLIVSGSSLENGGIINASTVSGINGSYTPTVDFNLANNALDYIGKTVNLLKTDGGNIAFDHIIVNGQTVSQGESTFERNGVEFNYTLTSQGSLVFDNTVITTESVSPSTEIQTEIVMGDVDTSGDTIYFTPAGNPDDKVEIAEHVRVSGHLDASSEILTQIDTIVYVDSEGRSHVTVNETPLGSTGLTLTVREPVGISASGEEMGTVGMIDGVSTINNVLLTTGAILTLDHTSLTMDQKFTANPGSELNLDDGSVVIIGGNDDTYPTEALASVIAKSTASQAKFHIEGGSVLKTEKVLHASGTTLDITRSTIELGDTDDVLGGTIAAGEGTSINIIDSIVSGNGILYHVNMFRGSLTAGHSPGILTLAGGNYSDMDLNVFIVTDNLLSGRINNNPDPISGNISQYKIEGTVTMTNVSFNILWEGDENPSLLSEGTSFQFIDLSEGTISGGLLRGNLPDLTNDLVWDLSSLTTTGVAIVSTAEVGEGERIANTMWSSSQVVSSFGSTALRHIHDFRYKGNNLWVSGLGDFASMCSRKGRTGYDYQGGGYAVGYDGALNTKDYILGIAFGQSFGKFKPKENGMRYSGGKVDQDGIMGALYGKQILARDTGKNVFWLEDYVAFGVVENDSTKQALYNNNLSPAKASWDDKVWSAGIKGVWSFEIDRSCNLSPFIGMEYNHVSQDDFTESMGINTARYASGSFQSWTLSAGATWDYIYDFSNGMELKPSLTAAYLGDVSRNIPTVDVYNGNIHSRESAVDPGRNGIYGAFNLAWKISRRWGAYTGYEIEARSGMTSQSCHLGVNYTF